MRSKTITPAEAIELQKRLSRRVIRETTFAKADTIAGVDVSVKGGMSYAAVVALSFPELKVIEQSLASRPADFPYIPGLLAFREAPVILEAFEKLTIKPDLMIVDGQGIAHPRGFGIASHLGVELDIPSIGCAKSRLVGQFREPAERRGSKTALYYGREIIGAVVRTKDHVKPVYVSIGHRVDLETAIRFTLRLARGYRLPEPIRAAHRAAGEAWR